MGKCNSAFAAISAFKFKLVVELNESFTKRMTETQLKLTNYFRRQLQTLADSKSPPLVQILGRIVVGMRKNSETHGLSETG